MFFQQLQQKCVVRQQLRREQESPLEDHKLCPENKQTKKTSLFGRAFQLSLPQQSSQDNLGHFPPTKMLSSRPPHH